MTSSDHGLVWDEAVRVGANGLAKAIEREQVAGSILGAEAFSLEFDVAPVGDGQAGEILRLGTSFIVHVDKDGELVVRAETEGGEMARLTTIGAGMDQTGSKSVDIVMNDGRLSVIVDDSIVGQIGMPSPVTANGWDGHDLSIGNPWSNDNYESTLSGLQLSPEALPLPELTEAQRAAFGPLLGAEEAPEFGLSEPVELAANGRAQEIARDHVEDLLVGSESFAIDFDMTPTEAGQRGEIMRLGTSFIVHVDRDGELVVRAEADNGELMRLTTDGAGMDQAGAKSIGIDLADGALSVEVDGREVGRIEMPSPITVNGWDGHDFSIGNPWSNENYQGQLSNLTIGSGQVDGEEVPVGIAPEQTPEEITVPPELALPHPSEDDGVTGDVIRVSDLNELRAALAEAKGGETIALAAGSYGELALNQGSGFDYAYEADVTITSADPEDRATFSGLDIRDGRHIAFDNVVFDYEFSQEDAIYHRPFSISGSRDISISNSVFSGDRAAGVSEEDDGHGWGIGLSVRDSENVSLTGTEFSEFWKAAGFSRSSSLEVRGNDFRDIRMDGLNFIAVEDLVVEGNHLHDFDRAWGTGDHADMIQFWTRGTDTPSRNVVIRDNYLDIGEGGVTQSIFMRNEEVDSDRAGKEMFYENVTIENNVIVNGHLNGITVGETDGLFIRKNTLLRADGADADDVVESVDIPLIRVASASENVAIERNITSVINGWDGQKSWSVSDNAFVQDQDPAGEGYYGDVFLSSSLELSNGRHEIIARPGGLADELDAGADGTHGTGSGLAAVFHVVTPQGEAGTRYFDARYSLSDGEPLPEGASYKWTFGDGSVAEGPVVARHYADGSPESVKLEVSLPDGTSSTSTYDFEIPVSVMLSYTSGADFLSDDGTVFDVADLATDEGLSLGRDGASLRIEKSHMADLLSTDEFSISFGLDAASDESQGEVFRYGTNLVAEVTDDGELSVRAATKSGEKVRFETKGAGLDDGETHDVALGLAEGRLSVSVDGRSLGEAVMTDFLKESGNHGIYFGSPWGHDNFEGLLTSFEMTRDASDFAEETMSHVVTPEEADALLAGL